MTDRAVYCEDWGCPSAVRCRHHFGRSHAYAAMRRDGYELRMFGRRAGADACGHWAADVARSWLLETGARVAPEDGPDAAPKALAAVAGTIDEASGK